MIRSGSEVERLHKLHSRIWNGKRKCKYILMLKIILSDSISLLSTRIILTIIRIHFQRIAPVSNFCDVCIGCVIVSNRPIKLHVFIDIVWLNGSVDILWTEAVRQNVACLIRYDILCSHSPESITEHVQNWKFKRKKVKWLYCIQYHVYGIAGVHATASYRPFGGRYCQAICHGVILLKRE